jgi:hypothetical protein
MQPIHNCVGKCRINSVNVNEENDDCFDNDEQCIDLTFKTLTYHDNTTDDSQHLNYQKNIVLGITHELLRFFKIQ